MTSKDHVDLPLDLSKTRKFSLKVNFYHTKFKMESFTKFKVEHIFTIAELCIY